MLLYFTPQASVVGCGLFGIWHCQTYGGEEEAFVTACLFQPHPIAWGQPPAQMANTYVTDCWSRSQLPPLQYRLALPCRMRVSLLWVMLGQVQLRGGEKPSKGKAGLHKALGTADKVLLSSAAGQRAERRVEGEG